MIKIQASGGWAYGPPGGPQIDIIPTILGIEVSISNIVGMVCSRAWDNWSEFLPQRGWRAVYTSSVSDRLVARFSWPKSQEPLDALLEIERHEGGLPYALAAACYAAAVAPKLPNPAPAIAAQICSFHRTDVGSVSVMNSRQVRDVAKLVASKQGQFPSGAIDRVRVLLAASSMLWQDDMLRFWAARFDNQPLETLLYYGTMSSLSPVLMMRRKLSYLGYEIEVDTERGRQSGAVIAWPQWLELYRHNCPVQCTVFMWRGEFSDAWQDGELDPSTWSGYNNRALVALADRLIEDATNKAAFAPSGQFTLNLPPGFPLRDRGIDALRISADPQGLWVGVVNGGKCGIVFRWQPEHEHISRLLVADWQKPLLSATCAALWRDLCVAGEDAVPKRSGFASLPKSNQKKDIRRKLEREIYFPRRGARQPLLLSGTHEWGGDEERKIIERRAHFVRAHFRRCEHPSPTAIANAEAYGWIVPRGYTFVRAHVRGTGEVGEAEGDTVVHAKGLSTIMAIAGDSSGG